MDFLSWITWKRFVLRLLGFSVLQTEHNCWAIALVKNLEFECKRHFRLMHHETLSIQELMNNANRVNLTPRGGSRSLEVTASEFLLNGTVLEHLCPFTQEILPAAVFTQGVVRFRPSVCRVVSLASYFVDNPPDLAFHLFCCQLGKDIDAGPITVRFRVYPSCENTLRQGFVYLATIGEMMQNTFHGHVALATALGTVDGIVCLELQDSQGPDWGGHMGFSYVALTMVDEYVIVRC